MVGPSTVKILTNLSGQYSENFKINPEEAIRSR